MEKRNTPRLAIMGAGLIGRMHIAHAAHAECLSAIVDPDPLARQLAMQHSVPWFATLPELIDSQGADGIVIATPTQLHVENGLACIAAGIPILVEKPVAQSVPDAEQLVAAGESARVAVLVGHHRRYNPLIQQAYEKIQAGHFGQLVAVHASCWLYKPNDYYDIAWRRTTAAGPVLTNLIHDIDLLRYLCGEVVSVQAYESRQLRKHAAEESAVLIMRFLNGALGTVTVSDSIVAPWSWELTANENSAYPHTSASCYHIGGTRGSLSLPELGWWRNPDQPNWHEPMTHTHLQHGKEDPLALQIRHFCEVIRGVAKPLVSGLEGLKTLRVVAAAKKAAHSGQQHVLAG